MGLLSQSIEDYLEAIYVLKLENKKVGVKKIAGFLNISLPSVTGQTNRLKEKGLIYKEKYGEIILTKKGENVAKETYSKHLAIFNFLHNILKVKKDIALKEACAIEHSMSKNTAQKLKQFMKKEE